MLTIHFAIVMFVVGGLVLILVGHWWHWRWVDGWWFRLAHLAAIAVVVAQAWLGLICPLTALESRLRELAGSPGYDTSFIEHWLGRALYYEAPAWVFTVAYTVFGVAVVATWWRFPPRRRSTGAR